METQHASIVFSDSCVYAAYESFAQCSCRFKKAEERTEYVAAMKTLLPLLYERMMGILADQSIPSVMLQHIILKIFYATMQASVVQCNKLARVHGIPGSECVTVVGPDCSTHHL